MSTDAKNKALEAIEQAESALQATKEEGSEKIRVLKEKLGASLLAAKVRVSDLEQATRERAVATAKATDDFVHENPWKVLGAGVALGFLVGMLSSRR